MNTDNSENSLGKILALLEAAAQPVTVQTELEKLEGLLACQALYSHNSRGDTLIMAMEFAKAIYSCGDEWDNITNETYRHCQMAESRGDELLKRLVLKILDIREDEDRKRRAREQEEFDLSLEMKVYEALHVTVNWSKAFGGKDTVYMFNYLKEKNGDKFNISQVWENLNALGNHKNSSEELKDAIRVILDNKTVAENLLQ